MNYDQPMVLSVMFFFSGYLCLRCAILPSYRFLASFSIVRKALLEEYDKQLHKLEHENALLKRGIIITKEETGQLKFDLPADTLPEMIRLPFESYDGWWCQYWVPEDYAAYKSGKVLVKRGRKKLWVDEPRSTDRLAELPCETIYLGDQLPA